MIKCHWFVIDQIVRAITLFRCLRRSRAKVRWSERKIYRNYAPASTEPPRRSLHNYIAHLALWLTEPVPSPAQQHSRKVTLPAPRTFKPSQRAGSFNDLKLKLTHSASCGEMTCVGMQSHLVSQLVTLSQHAYLRRVHI